MPLSAKAVVDSIRLTNSTNTTHNVGDRAFPVAGSRLWNSLPHVVTSAPTLAVFRKRLKTYLFFSFVRCVTDTPCTDTPFSGLAVFDFSPL